MVAMTSCKKLPLFQKFRQNHQNVKKQQAQHNQGKFEKKNAAEVEKERKGREREGRKAARTINKFASKSKEDTTCSICNRPK